MASGNNTGTHTDRFRIAKSFSLRQLDSVCSPYNSKALGVDPELADCSYDLEVLAAALSKAGCLVVISSSGAANALANSFPSNRASLLLLVILTKKGCPFRCQNPGRRITRGKSLTLGSELKRAATAFCSGVNCVKSSPSNNQ